LVCRMFRSCRGSMPVIVLLRKCRTRYSHWLLLRHGWSANDRSYVKISLFVSMAFFLGAFTSLLFFWFTRPFWGCCCRRCQALSFTSVAHYLTKLCSDSPKRLATISRDLTSGDLFASMSVMILPTVHNASRPNAFKPLQTRGLTVRKNTA
jgi:hypothetical protein